MTVIVYFTGTGNSLHSAKVLAEALVPSSLFRLDRYLDLEELEGALEKAKRMVLITPVYAGTLPHMVREFLENLRVPEELLLYSIATCGGGDLSTPMDVESVLRKKGRRLSNYWTLHYPSNYQSLRPPVDRYLAKDLSVEAERNLREIAKSIEAHEEKRIQLKKGLMLLSRLSLKLFVKGKNDRHFYSEENCVHCALCERVCPARNITMEEMRPQWRGHCENCMACLNLCPVEAIQYKKKTKKWGRYQNPMIRKEELICHRVGDLGLKE